MIAWEDYNKLRKKRGYYKNTTKEERARSLNNIICPKCKYQNHKKWIQLSGKCHLCGVILDKDYFKKTMLRRLKNG